MKLKLASLLLIPAVFIQSASAGGYDGGTYVVLNKANARQFYVGLKNLLGEVPESTRGNANQ